MVHVVEKSFDVPFHCIGTLGLPEDMVYSGHRVRCISHRPKSVAMVEELCFKYGFNHHPDDLLKNPIHHGWNPQRSFFLLSWFINPDSAYRSRLVVLECLLYQVNALIIVLR